MNPPQGPVARYGADFHQSFASVEEDFTVEENSKAAILIQLGMEVIKPRGRHQYNQYQHFAKECVQVVSHLKSSVNIVFSTPDSSIKMRTGAQPASPTMSTGAFSPGQKSWGLVSKISPRLAPRLFMSRSVCTSTLPLCLHQHVTERN